jgi:hypothetical protein
VQNYGINLVILKRKPIVITPEDELADALDEMARDIALIEPDPMDWGGWMICLLEQMKKEAKRSGMQVSYKEMLRSLKQDIGG